jgi:hypothetical protein
MYPIDITPNCRILINKCLKLGIHVQGYIHKTRLLVLEKATQRPTNNPAGGKDPRIDPLSSVVATPAAYILRVRTASQGPSRQATQPAGRTSDSYNSGGSDSSEERLGLAIGTGAAFEEG